jgi:predicted Zn-dependent protease
VQLRKLELLQEPQPSGLPDEDYEAFSRAHELMQKNMFPAARELLEPLAERHPEATSVIFNLAMTEWVAGGSAAVRAEERLEKLVRDHPHYLFARSHLARQALHEGNLERAQELLRLPEDLTRIHIQEYSGFLLAQGQLAVAMNELDRAEQIMESLEEMVGRKDKLYLVLKDELRMRGRNP